MNDDSDLASAGPERTPSLSGWRPPPRAETGRPDYGLDTPRLVATAFACAGGAAAAAALLGAVRVAGRRIPVLPALAWFASAVCAAAGSSLVAYAKAGKFRARDAMLDLVTWTGAERVLDVGTGGGLLMIGAAKRLTTGRAFGVDTWRADDLTNNNRENTMRNAFLEGVVDRVDVRFEDARTLGFPSRSFDVVFSNLALHAIETRYGRDAACREIARVLRPGGTAVVTDRAHVADYASAFREADLDVRVLPPSFASFTYLRTLVATKAPVIDLIGSRGAVAATNGERSAP
jgi:SAM-dependent methyltransferase